MANSNCLENMACPNCGSLGPYTIDCTTSAEVSDNGVEETGDMEWDSDSSCTCRACGHGAEVKDFYIEAEEDETAE